MGRILSVLALSLMCIAPCRGQDAPKDLVAAADRIATSWLSRRGAVGFSVCIAKADQILVSRGYGAADAEWPNPVTEDTAFRACSVSKQFEAAAILRLAEQHKLSLDDDVRKYIPEFPAKPQV